MTPESFLNLKTLSVDDIIYLGKVAWKVTMVAPEGIILRHQECNRAWVLTEEEYNQQPFSREAQNDSKNN